MVELRGIGKYFPVNGVYALDNAGFELRPGEIHALLGENGAGKSTLMHVMAGYLKPSTGTVRVNGTERRFAVPADALAAGIGMVRQYPQLAPGLKVWEDCILGCEPRSGPFISRKKARDRIRSLSERWGFDLPIDRPTDSLSVSLRQKAAILALLLRDAGYLIFDEPTAVLTPEETRGLFRLFTQLRAEGKGIALISHKLEETLGLADRVTVLRRGTTAAVCPAASLDGKSLRALMFGLEEGEERPGEASPPVPPRFPRAAVSQKSALLAVRGLSVEVPGRPFIRGVDLEVSPGRILGITGVRDSGLETLELALTGFLRPARGTVAVNGQDVTGRGPRAFRLAGAAYLGAGISGSAPSLSIRDNAIIHAHRRSTRSFRGKIGLLDRAYLDAWTAMVLRFAGLSRSPKARMSSFSGGMIQRLLLAREYAEEAALLVLAEPGQGLDQAGRAALLPGLQAYAASGRGLLVFSTDTEELALLADEILVLRNGVFSARLLPERQKNREDPAYLRELKRRIGRAMTGETAAEEAVAVEEAAVEETGEDDYD